MKIPFILAITTILLSNPMIASADDGASCPELASPVTSVADFDGNGVVNGKDIAILAKHLRKSRSHRGKKRGFRSRDRASKRRNHEHASHEVVYSAMYDRNSDGKVNYIDMFKSTRDMNKESTARDQELATISNAIMAGASYICDVQQPEPSSTLWF